MLEYLKANYIDLTLVAVGAAVVIRIVLDIIGFEFGAGKGK
jgi:hypothetical protein